MKINHLPKFYTLFFALIFFLMSCEKEDELVVDRVVSPVLITVSGSSFLATEPVRVTTGIYELDKSGILDNKVGLDTIPVTGLAVKVMLNNAAITELTTDAAGQVSMEKTWAELGLATPTAGRFLVLEWSGSHKGQAFTKTSRVVVK